MPMHFCRRLSVPYARYLYKTESIKRKGTVVIGRRISCWCTGCHMAHATRCRGRNCDEQNRRPLRGAPTADIIVSGAGSPHLIKRPGMLKDGVVLIDAGTSESNGTRGRCRPRVCRQMFSLHPRSVGISTPSPLPVSSRTLSPSPNTRSDLVLGLRSTTLDVDLLLCILIA